MSNSIGNMVRSAWIPVNNWERGLAHKGPIVRVGPNMSSIDDPGAAAAIYSTHKAFPKSRWHLTFQQPDEPNIFSTHSNKYAADTRKKCKPAYDTFH